MAKMKIIPKYTEIISTFNSITGAKSLWQVFNDCIEMFAIQIQNVYTFGKKYNDAEKRYKQISEQYTVNEMNQIVKIFAKITELLEENPFQDLLGDLYMRLNMGSDALGQFFTPYCVSQMMVRCTIDIANVKNEICKRGYITLNEPCIGGGANIIAACEWLYINNINFQSQCIIVGQELSKLTALMCYVALSMIGCSAVIKVGDTLSEPYTNYMNEVKNGSELWTTPMFYIHNGCGRC